MTERRLLWALLAAAFAVRVLYCWGFSPYDPHEPVQDISNYHSFAISILERGGLEFQGKPSAAREPGYPVFLAALYSVAGSSYSVVWAAQSFLGAAMVWLAFFLGRRVFSRNVAWLVAILCAFYPQFIYYSASPERETLQVLLLLAAVTALVEACRKPSYARFAGTGALWALCPLVNTTLLAAGLASALGAWLMLRRRRKDAPRRVALHLAVFLGLYALWPIRNYVVFQRFIPGVTFGGAHLYVSLIVPNEAAGTPEEARYIEADPVMRGAEDLPEDVKDRYFYRAAVRKVARHPMRFVGVMLGSLVKLWRLYPYQRDYGVNYRVVKAVALFSDGWLIPLGLVGLILAGRRFPETDLFNLILFSSTLAYMVFWAIIRYRLPLMPYVLLYAAYALERAAQRWRPQLLPFKASAS